MCFNQIGVIWGQTSMTMFDNQDRMSFPRTELWLLVDEVFGAS